MAINSKVYQHHIYIDCIQADLDKKYEQYEKGEIKRIENRLKNLIEEPIKSEGDESKDSTTSQTTTSKASQNEVNETDDEKTEKLVEQLLKEIKVDDDEDDAVI